MSHRGLSKSDIIAWKQCPKRLWLDTYRRDLLEVSDQFQQTFEIGFEVGEIARQLHPNGILIEGELSSALSVSKSAIQQRQALPLFEATFQYDGLLVRTDLLVLESHEFRMIEVKASANIKQYHLDDCAIQAWVLKQNKVPIKMIEIAHVNTEFIYQGNRDYLGLFNIEDATDIVEARILLVPEWIYSARATLSKDEPNIEPGLQCGDPFECPFKHYCAKKKLARWSNLPIL